MTEVVIAASKSVAAASPVKLRRSPSKKMSKGKSPRKEKDVTTPTKVPNKSTTKTSSTKKVEKVKKQKILDSPMPLSSTEKRLKRKIDSSRNSKEQKQVAAAEPTQETSVPPQTNNAGEPKSPRRRNSPSQASELLSWENKEHDKLFSTQSTSSAQKDMATPTPPTPQSSVMSKASFPSPSPGKRIMAATTTLASQMNFMKPSTPFEADKSRIPIVSPDLKGSGNTKPRAKLPTSHHSAVAMASGSTATAPTPPPRSPKPSTTPKQKTKKPVVEAVSPRQASVAPELNLIKRTTPFEVDAPRQVLRQQSARMTSTDSLTSYDDGCMTEEQRVWKGIDSVLMDADSVSTTTSDNHIVRGTAPGMYSNVRARSGKGLKDHLNKKTPMTAGDMVSVASMEDVNSKSMLRAVRKNSMQASLNLSKAIAESLLEEDEDDRQPTADDASLPSLASLSTCNTSTSSNPMPAASSKLPSKLPSKLDRFMQKSKQGSTTRRDDGSMPSLTSFRDDDFSQCSSVMSMGMPSLCSIREDELGSYRSQNDEDWRNGVSTIPEGNETLLDSPVKGKYADLWAESPHQDDDLDQSVESLQLEDLLDPATPNPAKLTQKGVMKKRRSLSGAEPLQSKLRSFMSSFIGGDSSHKQTDVLSVGSAGDIHTGNVSPCAVQRMHASDGCLLGMNPHESSNNKSSRMNISGNMSATDFSHFASENAKNGSANFEEGCPNTPSRHRRALLNRVSNSIAKIKSRVMTKGMLSPKLN